MLIYIYSSSCLPADIDSGIAVACLRSQREGLLNLIRQCLPSLSNSFYAQFLIPQDVYEEVNDQNFGKGKKGMILLDCIEARMMTAPKDFIKIVRVLESEKYLELLASQLVHSYSEYVLPT